MNIKILIFRTKPTQCCPFTFTVSGFSWACKLVIDFGSMFNRPFSISNSPITVARSPRVVDSSSSTEHIGHLHHYTHFILHLASLIDQKSLKTLPTLISLCNLVSMAFTLHTSSSHSCAKQSSGAGPRPSWLHLESAIA